MNSTQEQDVRQQLKRAGKDLMPIIVIFGFTIVMTIVVVTLSALLRENRNKAAMSPSVLDHRYVELLQQGAETFQRNKYGESEKIYKRALELANQNPVNTLPLLQAELELRLADIAAAQKDIQTRNEHLRHAEQYIRAASAKLSGMLRKNGSAEQ